MRTAQPVGILVAPADSEQIKNLHAAILAILTAPHVGESAKVKALEVLEAGVSVKNTTVQSCTFEIGVRK